jgi:hypothetical protein
MRRREDPHLITGAGRYLGVERNGAVAELAVIPPRLFEALL